MILPSIPDSTYKVLLYLGLIFIGYSFIQSVDAIKTYNEHVNLSNSVIDSLKVKELYQKREKDKLVEMANDLSKRYNIPNPITDKDTVTVFNITYRGPKEEVMVSDRLQTIWTSFKNGNFEIDLLNEKIKMTKDNLKKEEDDYDQVNYFYAALAFLGLLLSLGGYAGMERYQKMQEKLLYLEISQKDTKYKYCQSCGRTFSSVVLHGHNANGEINTAFCTECFDNGKFTEPNLTLEEFKDRIRAIVASKKTNKERQDMQKRFDDLERWKTDLYT